MVGLRSREPGAATCHPDAKGLLQASVAPQGSGYNTEGPLHLRRRPRDHLHRRKARYTWGDAHGIIYTVRRPATPAETPTKEFLHYQRVQRTVTRYPDAQGRFTPPEGPLHLRRRTRRILQRQRQKPQQLTASKIMYEKFGPKFLIEKWIFWCPNILM